MHENNTRGRNSGGGVNIFTMPPSGHRTQAYFSLMKQIHVSRTNIVKKIRMAIKT